MKRYLVTFTIHLGSNCMEETNFVAFNCYDNAKDVYKMLCDNGNITDCFLSEVEDN